MEKKIFEEMFRSAVNKRVYDELKGVENSFDGLIEGLNGDEKKKAKEALREFIKGACDNFLAGMV